MRQRKKPILLITILVCSLGAVSFMTYQPSKSSQSPDPQKEPETGNEQVKNQKPQDAKSIADQVKTKMASASPNKPKLMPMEGGMPDSSGPIALKLQPKPSKPMYMPDSATSTQWYTGSTALAAKDPGKATNVPPSNK